MSISIGAPPVRATGGLAPICSSKGLVQPWQLMGPSKLGQPKADPLRAQQGALGEGWEGQQAQNGVSSNKNLSGQGVGPSDLG
ncbi:unnamed protein product [Prunus armeniaca]